MYALPSLQASPVGPRKQTTCLMYLAGGTICVVMLRCSFDNRCFAAIRPTSGANCQPLTDVYVGLTWALLWLAGPCVPGHSCFLWNPSSGLGEMENALGVVCPCRHAGCCKPPPHPCHEAPPASNTDLRVPKPLDLMLEDRSWRITPKHASELSSRSTSSTWQEKALRSHALCGTKRGTI